jgi:ABC-type dipeptide/oligopeptide/nickel transport system permease subunit
MKSNLLFILLGAAIASIANAVPQSLSVALVALWIGFMLGLLLGLLAESFDRLLGRWTE